MAGQAVIYTRLSRDPKGDKPNVADQERRCRLLAESKGLEVVHVFTDRDRTAAGRDPFRPEYDELKQWVKDGRTDAVIALDQDRLVREPRELEALLALCEDAGLQNVHTAEGDLNLSSPRDIFVARIRAAVAADEVANVSKRISRKMEALRLEGNLPGGGNRPFGYEDDRRTVRQDEAEIIRDACRRILAGEPLRGIVRDWRENVPTVAGGTWSMHGVKRLLTSPRIAGMQGHNGEVVAEAKWDAIIDLDTHERVKAVLHNPDRWSGRDTIPRRHFLTGILMCGKCGTRMHGRWVKQKLVYACPPKADGGCGGIGIMGEDAEQAVRNMLIARLAGGGIAKALEAIEQEDTEIAELTQALRADEQRLEQLEVAHFTGDVTNAGYAKARQVLTDRIDATKRRLTANHSAHMAQTLPRTEDALEAEWEARHLEWRVALTKSLVDHIVVQPAKRGANRFDPERLQPRWLI